MVCSRRLILVNPSLADDDIPLRPPRPGWKRRLSHSPVLQKDFWSPASQIQTQRICEEIVKHRFGKYAQRGACSQPLGAAGTGSRDGTILRQSMTYPWTSCCSATRSYRVAQVARNLWVPQAQEAVMERPSGIPSPRTQQTSCCSATLVASNRATR